MQTSRFSARPRRTQQSNAEVDDETAEAVFDALHDDDCRAILEAVDESPRATKEIADACELPLSTTYRKVDMLTEADLLEERTRMDMSGNHASEYVSAVDDVTVTVANGELSLELTRREHDEPEHRAATMANAR
jgi:DNA-binding transcriptional ArsR family regulator